MCWPLQSDSAYRVGKKPGEMDKLDHRIAFCMQ